MSKNKKQNTIKVTINDNSLFTRNEEDFLVTEVDGETVMMNVENGNYWGFNFTSTDIWNILEQPQTYQSVINKLLEVYDVDEPTCKKETLQVLVGMLQINALKLDNSKIEESKK